VVLDLEYAHTGILARCQLIRRVRHRGYLQIGMPAGCIVYDFDKLGLEPANALDVILR
jgi:hypothetical protein